MKSYLFIFASFSILCLLALRPILPLLDVQQNLSCIIPFRETVHVFPTESTEHTLENVADLRLEVILVVMRPAQQSGYELFQVRAEEIDGHGVDSELDITQSRFDNFTVIRGDEDQQCSEYLRVHLGRNRV